VTRPCCARQFAADRDGGELDAVAFTVGRCRGCGQTLVRVRSPYGPPEGSVHAITAEKHGQLVEGGDVDLEIFRRKWLEDR